MFSTSLFKQDQFLKQPDDSPLNLLRYCSRQQLPRDLQNNIKTKKPTEPKISIKKLLKRNQGGSVSCTSLSQFRRLPSHNQGQWQRCFSGVDDRSCGNSSLTLDGNRGVMKTNSLQFGQAVHNNQIRIIYQNQIFTKPIESIHQTIKIDQPQIETTANQFSNVADGNKKNQATQLCEGKRTPFSEFVSFGPKNLGAFKKMSSFEIDHVQSDIIQQTQKTDKCQLHEISITQQRRLTKTCSQFQIQREIKKFSTPNKCPPRLQREGFHTSQLFTSVKHTQTMKNDYSSSDRQSQVIENFQSLIQKVNQNRMENWSFTSEYVEI